MAVHRLRSQPLPQSLKVKVRLRVNAHRLPPTTSEMAATTTTTQTTATLAKATLEWMAQYQTQSPA
jgi:hypothetical protein